MWPQHPFVKSTNLIGIDPDSWKWHQRCPVNRKHAPVELLFRGDDDERFTRPLPLFGWTFKDGTELTLRICRYCGCLYPELLDRPGESKEESQTARSVQGG
jgi:hypothetical protein